jgi:Aerotolerance regulator N-terminal/von Willebrand factor type A domain
MHTILIVGAALVGLPILLHLIMKQEPKRLTFPAFRFLTQRLKTNQRKLRLRHFVLLALRMLLIALFCLALYQPTILSQQFSLVGEQPVAVVIVIDTSPSMAYTANGQTRLEDARRRALELLDTLPDKSAVAVVDTADLSGHWGDVAAARKELEKLDKPRGGNQPVTSALAAAYQLLAKIDAPDAEDADRLPKLVAVFTDRTAACWDPARVDDLKKLRDAIPDPKAAHAIVDVGADHPTNVAILAAEMKPQVIAANQPAVVTVTVAATGPAGESLEVAVGATVVRLDAKPVAVATDKKRVTVPYGQSRPLTFEFTKLKAGTHQVEFALESGDSLAFDNTRFLTFKVGAARRVLAIADDPADAVFWQAGLAAAKEPFSCYAVAPDQLKTRDGRTIVEYAPDPKKPEETVAENIREFEAVCLLSVADPSRRLGNTPDTLWDHLRAYVEGGGKLAVIPGGDLSRDGYAAGGDLMPGTLGNVIDVKDLQPPPPPQTAPGWDGPSDGKNGVTWFLMDDKILQHPMLRPLQEWRTNPKIDAVKYPRRTRKYWEVKPAPGSTVIVQYNDAEKAADRHPAVLERNIKTKGRVVLLTTRMDVPADEEKRAWHDYWEFDTTWFSVFPWMVVRYLAGDTADANFNHAAGQSVAVALPKGGVPRGTKVVIDGPGLDGNDALIEVGDKQTELRVNPPRTNQPGNFALSVDAVKWRDGFSLNVPAEESTLDKVPVEAVEDLTGKNSVLPVDKNLRLRDALDRKFNQPVDLFPWLLIAVLVLLAVEGLVANRFYRRVK